MSIIKYIDTLKFKHENLKNKIKNLYTSPNDNMELIHLKKQKLQLKEKIANLASQLNS